MSASKVRISVAEEAPRMPTRMSGTSDGRTTFRHRAVVDRRSGACHVEPDRRDGAHRRRRDVQDRPHGDQDDDQDVRHEREAEQQQGQRHHRGAGHRREAVQERGQQPVRSTEAPINTPRPTPAITALASAAR